MLKVQMQERIEQLEAALADIVEELESDDPDLNAIRHLISEALAAAEDGN